MGARARKIFANACARKNKRSACMLADACKDHSIPLVFILTKHTNNTLSVMEVDN